MKWANSQERKYAGATHSKAPALEPEERLHRTLRWIYFPYACLVFVPFLLVSTLFWGVAALATSRLISQRVGFHCGAIWAWCLCKANFTRVRLSGREHADPKQSYVIMSNHQSHFDVLAFHGAWGRQFRWVIKQELCKTPGLGWGCAGVGHIFIDRSNRERAIASLNAARPKLTNGVSVMFFPEGTRSRDGRLQEFKKGGFMMALDLGLPILPVSISGSHRVLPSGTLKLLPGCIRIQVHEPVDVSLYGAEGRDRLIEDVKGIYRCGAFTLGALRAEIAAEATENDG